jgi:hypothetical protein
MLCLEVTDSGVDCWSCFLFLFTTTSIFRSIGYRWLLLCVKWPDHEDLSFTEHAWNAMSVTSTAHIQCQNGVVLRLGGPLILKAWLWALYELRNHVDRAHGPVVVWPMFYSLTCDYFYCLLSQAFSSWYFSWTSSDPHRSGFKFHTAVLSVLCVMFQV